MGNQKVHEIVVYNVYKKTFFTVFLLWVMTSVDCRWEKYLNQLQDTSCGSNLSAPVSVASTLRSSVIYRTRIVGTFISWTLLFCFFFHKQRYLILCFIEFLSKQFVNIKLNYLFLQIKSRINLINQPWSLLLH